MTPKDDSDEREYVQAPSDFLSLAVAILIAIAILGLIIVLSVVPT